LRLYKRFRNPLKGGGGIVTLPFYKKRNLGLSRGLGSPLDLFERL